MRESVKDNLKKLGVLDDINGMDGPFIVDFIKKLDKVVDILQMELNECGMDVLIGVVKESESQSILEVVTMATLIKCDTSGVEKTPWGLKIWFTW